jgi:hypothetical protein
LAQYEALIQAERWQNLLDIRNMMLSLYIDCGILFGSLSDDHVQYMKLWHPVLIRGLEYVVAKGINITNACILDLFVANVLSLQQPRK